MHNSYTNQFYFPLESFIHYVIRQRQHSHITFTKSSLTHKMIKCNEMTFKEHQICGEKFRVIFTDLFSSIRY